MSELIRIPVTAFLADKQKEEIPTGIDYRVVGRKELPSFLSGLEGPNARIILNYFELTEHLLSKSYVEFPLSDSNFTKEVIERAKSFGMAAVQIPGYSGVPKITELLRRREIDADIYNLLWGYVAPNIPMPMPFSFNSRGYESEKFLGTVLRQNKKLHLLEGDGTTDYNSTFHLPVHMLVEDFPDVVQITHYDKGRGIINDFTPPPAQESSLLHRLGIPRANIFYDDVKAAVDLHGHTVLEDLHLDPKQYRLLFLRYEDFLRLSSQYDWGVGPYYTYLQGFLVKDITEEFDHEAKLIKQVPIAGRNYVYSGLGNFQSVGRNQSPEQWERYANRNVKDVMVRFAISKSLPTKIK